MSVDRVVTGRESGRAARPAAPACESLEPRRLYAADPSAKLGLVHQGLRHPPCIADMNGDGLDDLVVMTAHSGGGDGVGVDVLINDGNGTFRPADLFAFRSLNDGKKSILSIIR